MGVTTPWFIAFMAAWNQGPYRYDGKEKGRSQRELLSMGTAAVISPNISL